VAPTPMMATLSLMLISPSLNPKPAALNFFSVSSVSLW
jgi:hypothetical protein